MRKQPIQILTMADQASVEILKSDTGVESKDIDFKDASDKKWLRNHIVWALNNGCPIILNPR